MSRSHDAIVIGAGVIGAATALGLARKGLGVLCVDRLPAAGYASPGMGHPPTLRSIPCP
jgi:sarcosine oxidase subunit beta